MQRVLLFLPLLAIRLLGDASPYSVATLVREPDAGVVSASLEVGLQSPAPLVRATAARVMGVRGLGQLLPRLRETLAAENDAIAAREEIRTLALLGAVEDIEAAMQSASRWPAAMDNAAALAIARRGVPDAVQIYLSTLRQSRMSNTSEFFRVALWGRPDVIAVTGSRVLGAGDERGWRGLLGALADSDLVMDGGVMASSLGSPSEDIRAASLWFLVRGYAVQPASMHDVVKQRIAEPRDELSSDREDFGLELLRRMLGGEKKDDPRWLRFLESEEADRLLIGETAAHQFLTDAEYAVRYARCEVQTRECAMPRKRSRLTIASQIVAPPAFDLPAVLPPGLTDEVLTGARCNDSWLGVATAAVDQAGRITKLDLASIVTTPRCKKAIDIILRLSMATNGSVRSAFTGPVLLVRSTGTSLCLDEAVPESTSTSTHRAGGAVQPPKVKKRVEPIFPASARQSMGHGRNVLVIVDSVISKTGCVRSMRIVEQSPYPELNGAALMALSQWTFAPGYLDGNPVDVHFNLTINFKTR